MKKVVDKMADMWYSNDCSAVVERVPCKLNNERNEKHQTGARESLWKRALERNWKACASGVKSITHERKGKKFEAMTNSSVTI